MKYVYLKSLGIQECEVIETFEEDSNVMLLEHSHRKSNFLNHEIFDSPEEIEIYQYKEILKKRVNFIDKYTIEIEKMKKLVKDSKTPRIKELIKEYPERFII